MLRVNVVGEGPEQDERREGGRKERKEENLFRIDMVVDEGLNITR